MDVKVARSDRGWEASVCEVDLTPKGKEIFGKEKIVSVPLLPHVLFLILFCHAVSPPNA